MVDSVTFLDTFRIAVVSNIKCENRARPAILKVDPQTYME